MSKMNPAKNKMKANKRITGNREKTLFTYKGEYLLPFNKRIFGSGLNTRITYMGNVVILIIKEKHKV